MEGVTFSILVPSRGRPQRFREMAESAIATAAHPETVCFDLMLDADDATAPQYPTGPQIVTHPAPGGRVTVPAAFDGLAAAATGRILMMGSDDVVFRTPGWDDKVLAAIERYPDGLVLVYPDDGHGNGKPGDIHGNHWFVTRRWVEVVGCFCPPQFEHFCCDTVPEKIAAQAGRFVHLPDVLVEHRHFKYKQSARDATYAYTREKDAQGRSMSERDNAKMAAMAPWIAERAAAVRRAVQQQAGGA